MLPSANDVVSTVIAEKTASELKASPLSNKTVARHINDMSLCQDIEEQLYNDLPAALLCRWMKRLTVTVY